ncbi:unnamed protein product [Penicillium olsonii]|nr:unnamed protein product [Penicillium olsonii]CAG7921373.1 unnamed protein product [Penicillium olsonii]
MVSMDSFLKESQRLHPPAALSAHRVCITDLKLSNGITLKKGSHVAVPSEVIQRSSSNYESPDSFDGFRFVKRAAAGDKNSQLVDLSPDYLVFGMGVHACPGRWMASALMKLALAHILTRFDITVFDSSSELHIKSSHEEAKATRRKKSNSMNERSSSPSEEDDSNSQSKRVESSFAASPQPFLDPPTWETMLKHSQERLAAQSASGGSSEASAAQESAERLRQRVDRETEYGSMAIRGRSSVRGRGKRGRGNGNVYWGGRY